MYPYNRKLHKYESTLKKKYSACKFHRNIYYDINFEYIEL